jgi:ubiquinol-cytochrome c reductase core subunit 2
MIFCVFAYVNTGAVTAAVLQQALGTGPHVQWGNGAGALQKAVAKATETYSVTGLNASYSDSGLVGFLLTTSAADAGKVRTVKSLLIQLFCNCSDRCHQA